MANVEALLTILPNDLLIRVNNVIKGFMIYRKDYLMVEVLENINKNVKNVDNVVDMLFPLGDDYWTNTISWFLSYEELPYLEDNGYVNETYFWVPNIHYDLILMRDLYDMMKYINLYYFYQFLGRWWNTLDEYDEYNDEFPFLRGYHPELELRYRDCDLSYISNCFFKCWAKTNTDFIQSVIEEIYILEFADQLK